MSGSRRSKMHFASHFPRFERLDFPPVGAGRVRLPGGRRDFARPFYANELSEGTLRFLWLATLLQSPGCRRSP